MISVNYFIKSINILTIWYLYFMSHFVLVALLFKYLNLITVLLINVKLKFHGISLEIIKRRLNSFQLWLAFSKDSFCINVLQ